jgi:predicted nucleotidyltransferase
VGLSLFGSTARGDNGPESDIDLLAAFDANRRISLLDIAGLEMDLSEMLGRRVDLAEEGTLKSRVQKSVEAEAVRAF